jgi:hypothetical protein
LAGKKVAQVLMQKDIKLTLRPFSSDAFLQGKQKSDAPKEKQHRCVGRSYLIII